MRFAQFMAKPIHELWLNSCRPRQFIASHLTRIKHIFNEDAVALGRLVDGDVGNGADELTVLDDGRARHECGQEGTTNFRIIY